MVYTTKLATVRDDYRGGAKTSSSTTLVSGLRLGPAGILITKVSCCFPKRAMSLAFNPLEKAEQALTELVKPMLKE